MNEDDAFDCCRKRLCRVPDRDGLLIKLHVFTVINVMKKLKIYINGIMKNGAWTVLLMI